MFRGFPEDGLGLLRRLPTFDKDEFQAHKSVYAATLQEPLKAFVDEVGPALRDRVSPGIQFAAKTHGSIGPINNDVRFNPEASTYKDHVLLRFWEGAKKKTAPTLFVRLTPDEVGFATGVAFADVDRWRRAVHSDGAALASALSALVRTTDASIVGQELKRVPKPYDADHPHADLLCHKWFQARWPRPLPTSVGSEAFVDYCVDELVAAAEVHRWLVDALT